MYGVWCMVYGVLYLRARACAAASIPLSSSLAARSSAASRPAASEPDRLTASACAWRSCSSRAARELALSSPSASSAWTTHGAWDQQCT